MEENKNKKYNLYKLIIQNQTKGFDELRAVGNYIQSLADLGIQYIEVEMPQQKKVNKK